MRKLIITFSVFFVMLFSLPFVNAQDKATDILKASKAKFDATTDFSANFKYSLVNPSSSKASATKQGKIKYKKGKFRIDMGDQEMICNKQKMWVYIKADKEVSVSPYDASEGINFEDVFKMYQKSGKTRYDGEELLNGANCHNIYIAIADDKSEYNQARVWVNKKTNMLDKMELRDRRQVKTIYEFTNLKTNNGFPDTEFVFDKAKYPGVQVFE